MKTLYRIEAVVLPGVWSPMAVRIGALDVTTEDQQASLTLFREACDRYAQVRVVEVKERILCEKGEGSTGGKDGNVI